MFEIARGHRKIQFEAGVIAALVSQPEAQALGALAGRGKEAGELGEQPPGGKNQRRGFFDRRRQLQ